MITKDYKDGYDKAIQDVKTWLRGCPVIRNHEIIKIMESQLEPLTTKQALLEGAKAQRFNTVQAFFNGVAVASIDGSSIITMVSDEHIPGTAKSEDRIKSYEKELRVRKIAGAVCKEINPEHPELVAQNIKEMYEIIKYLKENCYDYIGVISASRIDGVLSKIKGGE